MKNRAERAILLAVVGLGVSATLAAASTRPVPWRPRAWQPPAPSFASTALRSDPEAGESAGLAGEIAAQRRALADVPVQLRPDGSRFARVGGFARRYTVASIAADGSLVEDCVHSEGEAKRIVEAAKPRKER